MLLFGLVIVVVVWWAFGNLPALVVVGIVGLLYFASEAESRRLMQAARAGRLEEEREAREQRRWERDFDRECEREERRWEREDRQWARDFDRQAERAIRDLDRAATDGAGRGVQRAERDLHPNMERAFRDLEESLRNFGRPPDS